MAVDRLLDVTVEVPLYEIASQPDPTRALWELMRGKADQLCDESGARLRTDREPEVVVKSATTPLGVDMLLCASRWHAVSR